MSSIALINDTQRQVERVAEAASFPGLRDRAYRLLVESAGELTEATLAENLFRGQGTLWSTLLATVIGDDPRFDRTPDGWRLGRPESAPTRRALREVSPITYAPIPASPPAGDWARSVEPASAVTAVPTHFVALVTLATGPKPPRARVVAVGLAIVDHDRIIARGQWLFRPEPPPRRLPDDIVNAGIALEEVIEAPTFDAAGQEVIDFIGHLPIVGLDIALQVAFLQFERRRAGRSELDNPLVELSPLAQARLGGRPDLTRLAGALGVPPPRDRGPLRRAVCLAEVAARFTVSSTPSRRDATVTASQATQQRPLLDPSTAEFAPDHPGVYLFRDRTGPVLYVGKASSLRQRLRAYCHSDLNRTRNMSGLVAQTDVVETRPTISALDAAILEARLIAFYRPPYNVQQRVGGALTFIRVRLDRNRLRLDWPMTDDDDCIGPLFRRDARRVVTEALINLPSPGGRTKAARAARSMWANHVATGVAARLRDATVLARLASDQKGIAWIPSDAGEIGLTRGGWVGSRDSQTGSYLNPAKWPEPPSPLVEWAVALALARRLIPPVHRPHDPLPFDVGAESILQ